MQVVDQDLTSAAMESQMYFFFRILMVVLLDGWARPCTMSNTVFLNDGRTQGRGLPVFVSHRIVGPSGNLIC